MRERIAHQAARIIAEDGLQDYASAKHKAARQIGAPDTHSLPDNDEVERASAHCDGDVKSADADGKHACSAGGRRVAVGTEECLAGHDEAFEVDLVADPVPRF